MKVLSVSHLKGGVGKTTAAVNLAYLSAEQGKRTLLVDMDAQASATYIYRLDPGVGAGAKKVAHAKKSLRDEIFASDYPGLDLMPASLSFRKLPVLLAEEDKDKVREMLRKIGKQYDLLVVDAPAGLSLESEAILRASDLVLVPLVPSALGITSFETFSGFAAGRARKARLRAFFSMADLRRSVHRENIESLAGKREVWPVVVPYAAAVERVATERTPLPRIKRPGKSLAAYRDLWTRCADELQL